MNSSLQPFTWVKMLATMPILQPNQLSVLQKHENFCYGNFHPEPTESSNFPQQADAFERQINNMVFFTVIESCGHFMSRDFPFTGPAWAIQHWRAHLERPAFNGFLLWSSKFGGCDCCDKNKRNAGPIVSEAVVGSREPSVKYGI